MYNTNMDIRKKKFDMIKHVIIFSFELPNENHKIYEFTCYNTHAWRLGTCTNELYNILMSNFPTKFQKLLCYTRDGTRYSGKKLQ